MARSTGTLYRAMCREEYRPHELRKEGLQVLEQLGYLHRRRRVEAPSSRGLGLLARRRIPAVPKPAADNIRQAREWRERRRKMALVEAMAAKLGEIGCDQAADGPVPTRIWSELDRVVRAPQFQPPEESPGPGAYLRLERTKAGLAPSFGYRPSKVQRDSSRVPVNDMPGPGAYHRQRPVGAVIDDAPAFSFGRSHRNTKNCP